MLGGDHRSGNRSSHYADPSNACIKRHQERPQRRHPSPLRPHPPTAPRPPGPARRAPSPSAVKCELPLRHDSGTPDASPPHLSPPPLRCWPSAGSPYAEAVETRAHAGRGRQNLLYLPLTIAEQLGYFRPRAGREDRRFRWRLAGAARAGGQQRRCVVSGAFDTRSTCRPKGRNCRAVALMGRAPQIVLGVNPRPCNFKTVADLKGKKIGVTAQQLDQRDGQLLCWRA